MMKVTIKILLYARPRTGKTTLLAILYDYLRSNESFDEVEITSPEDAKLKETLSKLRKYIRSLQTGKENKFPGTKNQSTYTINVKVESGYSIDLEFTDIPGGMLEQENFVDDYLRPFDLIIVPISSPAMMEDGGEYNAELNKHIELSEHIQKIKDHSSRKQIFLVPIKSEGYDNEALKKQLEHMYRKVIVNVQKGGHALYFQPVHTFGTVVFDGFEFDNQNSPIDKYKLRSKANVQLKSKYHDVLLREIVIQGLEIILHNFDLAEAKQLIEKLKKQTRPTILKQAKKPIKEIELESGCFARHTPVLMANGQSIPIFQVKPEMEIVSINRDGKVEIQKVLRVASHDTVLMMNIAIDDKPIRVSSDHRFYTQCGWVAVTDMVLGTKIVGYDHKRQSKITKMVTAIDRNPVIDAAYNVYTSKTSTYCVEGCFVHSFVHMQRIRTMFEYYRNQLLVNKGTSYA